MKTCIECKIEFPATLEYFSKSRNSLTSYCKLCNNLISKAWHQANSDKVKARSKAYRENNLDKVKATNKAYKKSNPDKINASARKRRALEKGNGHEYYTENQVLQTYGTICNICFKKINLNAPRRVGQLGWQEGLHIDHLIPISKGGSDTLENVRPTHGLCNLNKSNKEQYEKV